LNRISVYTHDRNGNQLTRTVENETVVQTCPITGGEISATNWQTETYAYNVFNQLIRVDRPGVTAGYTYRTDGLRLTKTVNGATTTHVWLRGSIVLELNAAGNVSNWFVRSSAGQLIRSQHYGWYIINARGDVVQRVNNSGAITRAYHYGAFGMELTSDQSDTNPFRFAGEYWDAETQTYYLRARNFNPRTGRFTQPDPHWGIHNHIFGDSPTLRNGRNVPSIHAILQSGNLFMYTMHNPVFFNDPSGLYAVPVAIPAAAAPVVLIVGGVAIVVTGAYLLTPSGQQLLAEASWALVDGVELVGSALSYFSAVITSAASNTGSRVRGKIRGSITAGQSTPGNPDPRNNQEIERAIRSLERRLQEHQQKLNDYISNPDSFDNRGYLQNAPNEQVRDSIIRGRIKHLQQEIDAFQNQIDQLLNLLN